MVASSGEEMEKAEVQQANQNWSEAVEDLVTSGETEEAIKLLESEISKLETLKTPTEKVDLQLVSLLTELAKLYSTKHFSLKSDQLLSRASLIQHRGSSSSVCDVENKKRELKEDKEVSKSDAVLTRSNSVHDGHCTADGHIENSLNWASDAFPCNGSLDDDWEAIADRAPEELLSSPSLPSVSNISLDDKKIQTARRRGRGPFTYEKHKLYSDRQPDVSSVEGIDDEDLCKRTENKELIHSEYGSRHVLVLADFPPSTRTIELEKLFEDFKDHGVVIRWINDTAALAVFRTPSIALKARNHVRCPFTVRLLDEDDVLMGSITAKDLEPPRQRPKTSARTAQRLIAHGMGLKLPTTFGSQELRTQEEARRNRIVTRQNLKDDAWGDD